MSRAIPPSPPEMQTPLVGVLRFWGSEWCGRSHWFDEFAGSEFGRRRRPRAQRGVRLRDEPSNPTLSARMQTPLVGVLRSGERSLLCLDGFQTRNPGLASKTRLDPGGDAMRKRMWIALLGGTGVWLRSEE